jgi:hypothetical protein
LPRRRQVILAVPVCLEPCCACAQVTVCLWHEGEATPSRRSMPDIPR